MRRRERKRPGCHTCSPSKGTIIADNLSAHKARRVAQFLAAHPKLHLHYTPTYSSWLNKVENWFAKIERDVIARGIFTSVYGLGPQADALHPQAASCYARDLPVRQTTSEVTDDFDRLTVGQAVSAVLCDF